MNNGHCCTRTVGGKKCVLRPLDSLQKIERSAVLLLNGPTAWPPLWKKIWNNAAFRICADGAGNGLEALIRTKQVLLPDVLSGDMDSISEKALSFFKLSGVYVKETIDQDFTDMWKALRLVLEEISHGRLSVSHTIVLGGLSGRIDHTLSSFQSLLRFRSASDCPIYMVDGFNLVTILMEGLSELRLDGFRSSTTSTAGLIPFCQKRTTVTTEGFKWDLKDTSMDFGGCISTSNKVVNDTLLIKTTAPLIFTLELTLDILESSPPELITESFQSTNNL